MYNRFWGFNQKPFRLVPNPDFLYLSTTHEEALAHLKFTLSEGEGFLMITGEVGTGKSTLCRAFLKDLDKDVACAYIFNAKLNALQLLKNINAEFGLPADADTPHDLIEILNTFLIDQKALDKKVVIIIDEAQNLPVESLEQVRLLSNLETTRDKLLHIILVGQPELVKIIDSFELRQLGQRISLACQLNPLSYDETVQYIQHRLNVASLKPQMPFEKGTLKSIFGFSEGVPRLINIACDRMLLSACLKKQNVISRGLADEIVTELSRRGQPKPFGPAWYKIGIPAAAGVLLMIVAGWFYLNVYERDVVGMPRPLEQIQTAETPARPEPPVALSGGQSERTSGNDSTEADTSETTVAAVEPAEPSAPAMTVDDLVSEVRYSDSRREATKSVLQQWGLDPQGDMVLEGVDDLSYFQLVAERHGFMVHIVRDDLGELVNLNLPAIVQMTLPDSDQNIYTSLIGIHDGQYLLASHDSGVHAPVDERAFKAIWGGTAVVPWKNYLGYRGVIPGGTPRSSVVVLKQLLWEIGYSQLTINDRYDDQTRNAIKEIQAKNGLVVDGLVGDLTKIVLYNEKQGLPIPHLRQ